MVKPGSAFYINLLFGIIILLAVIVIMTPCVKNQNINKQIEKFQTSVDLYKDPNITDFEKSFNDLSLTLDDARDLLLMNRCISLPPGFFKLIDSELDNPNIPLLIKRFDVLIDPSTPTASSFSAVQDIIKKHIADLYTKLNKDIPPTAQNVNLIGPIYSVIAQAPFYPNEKGSTDYITLMNWQVGNTGFDFMPYNASKLKSNEPKVKVSTMMLFPKFNKDGTVSKRTDSEAAKLLEKLFENTTSDQLCFMTCLGNPNLACGCSSEEVKTADGKKPLYKSTCLSSDGNGDKPGTYAIVYQVNPEYPDFVSNGYFVKNANVNYQEKGLFEYPPPNYTPAYNKWDRSKETVVGLDGTSYSKYTMNVGNGAYGQGQYKVWSNSIWQYNPNGITDGEWSVTGAFDKISAGGVNGVSGWNSSENKKNINKDVDTVNPPYIAISLPNEVVLREYSLEVRTDCCVEQMPTKWNLYGVKNVGEDWKKIDSQDNIVWNGTGDRQRFKIANKNAYKSYKLEVIRNGSPWDNFTNIGEWRLYALSDEEGKKLSPKKESVLITGNNDSVDCRSFCGSQHGLGAIRSQHPNTEAAKWSGARCVGSINSVGKKESCLAVGTGPNRTCECAIDTSYCSTAAQGPFTDPSRANIQKLGCGLNYSRDGNVAGREWDNDNLLGI